MLTRWLHRHSWERIPDLDLKLIAYSESLVLIQYGARCTTTRCHAVAFLTPWGAHAVAGQAVPHDEAIATLKACA